jgi:hypothetical protein
VDQHRSICPWQSNKEEMGRMLKMGSKGGDGRYKDNGKNDVDIYHLSVDLPVSSDQFCLIISVSPIS